jgi:hypothetical protein
MSYEQSLIDFLLGKDASLPGDIGSMLRLRSPFRTHLNRISRFYSRPAAVELEEFTQGRANSETKPPRVEFLAQIEKRNPVGAWLDDLLEPVISEGWACIAIEHSLNRRGQHDGYFKFKKILPRNIVKYEERVPGYPSSVTSREVYLGEDGKYYYNQVTYSESAYQYWVSIPERRIRDLEEGKIAPNKVVVNPYGICPIAVAGNNPSRSPDFDATAVDIAIEIISQWSSSGESFAYYANQLLAAPNPNAVRNALARKERVLAKTPGEIGNTIDVIKMDGVPAHWQNWEKELEQGLSEHLGTTLVEMPNNSDFSTASLHTMFADQVSTALKKFNNISAGLAEAYSLCLIFGAIDGNLVDVAEFDESTHKVSIYYTTPEFPESPDDMVKRWNAAVIAIKLGVNPAYVIARDVYKEMSQQEADAIITNPQTLESNQPGVATV